MSRFVDAIWVAKADSIGVQSTLYAPLFTELIFNYGDTFNIEGEHVEQSTSRYQTQIISGLKTSPFKTTAAGAYGCVGVILKPYCYGFMLGRFETQAMSDISEVMHEHIFTPDSPNFLNAEKCLFELFEGFEIDSDLIKFERALSSDMLRSGAQRQFVNSLSVSPKSFIQKFKRDYMLTPSQYAKLRQVHFAIVRMKQDENLNVLHAGLDAGFYDQAHFTRVFKRFCGVTPFQFRKKELWVG